MTTRTIRSCRRCSRRPNAGRNARLTTLQGLATAPKPERTYDAITLSVNKRFSKNWLARASYTYSRLIGNYDGLYQAEQNYFAPNGNNAYDTPDLYANQNGPLPNDRPHLAHVDGFYTHADRQRRHHLRACRSRRARACRATTSRACVPGQQTASSCCRAARAAGRRPSPSSNGKIALPPPAVARR